jgi:hypothetical protein
MGEFENYGLSGALMNGTIVHVNTLSGLKNQQIFLKTIFDYLPFPQKIHFFWHKSKLCIDAEPGGKICLLVFTNPVLKEITLSLKGNKIHKAERVL